MDDFDGIMLVQIFYIFMVLVINIIHPSYPIGYNFLIQSMLWRIAHVILSLDALTRS